MARAIRIYKSNRFLYSFYLALIKYLLSIFHRESFNEKLYMWSYKNEINEVKKSGEFIWKAKKLTHNAQNQYSVIARDPVLLME